MSLHARLHASTFALRGSTLWISRGVGRAPTRRARVFDGRWRRGGESRKGSGGGSGRARARPTACVLGVRLRAAVFCHAGRFRFSAVAGQERAKRAHTQRTEQVTRRAGHAASGAAWSRKRAARQRNEGGAGEGGGEEGWDAARWRRGWAGARTGSGTIAPPTSSILADERLSSSGGKKRRGIARTRGGSAETRRKSDRAAARDRAAEGVREGRDGSEAVGGEEGRRGVRRRGRSGGASSIESRGRG